jgi:L-amino acid N-acyltransferase YncA
MHIRDAVADDAPAIAASVALHNKLGFEQVAQFSDVGFKFDQWRDVGYWQLKL